MISARVGRFRGADTFSRPLMPTLPLFPADVPNLLQRGCPIVRRERLDIPGVVVQVKRWGALTEYIVAFYPPTECYGSLHPEKFALNLEDPLARRYLARWIRTAHSKPPPNIRLLLHQAEEEAQMLDSDISTLHAVALAVAGRESE